MSFHDRCPYFIRLSILACLIFLSLFWGQVQFIKLMYIWYLPIFLSKPKINCNYFPILKQVQNIFQRLFYFSLEKKDCLELISQFVRNCPSLCSEKRKDFEVFLRENNDDRTIVIQGMANPKSPIKNDCWSKKPSKSFLFSEHKVRQFLTNYNNSSRQFFF